MKKSNDIIWGIILILIGVIFIGNEFNLWNIDVFFDGWWTLFIILPSIFGLFKKGNKLSSIFGLLIGILLLLADRDVIVWSTVGKIFLPAMLIFIGISIILKKNFKTDKVKNDGKNYIAIFSGCEENITNEEFIGTSITSIFGGVELNLKNAIIKENITINCTSVFGGIDIILPDNVKVETSGVPIFGGVENKSQNLKDSILPTVYINYVCVFAGIDIK